MYVWLFIVDVCLSLSEDGLCLFDSASGASMAAITCEEEIQVCIYMSVCNVNVCMFQCSICLCLPPWEDRLCLFV
jgi:hypothetical protein